MYLTLDLPLGLMVLKLQRSATCDDEQSCGCSERFLETASLFFASDNVSPPRLSNTLPFSE